MIAAVGSFQGEDVQNQCSESDLILICYGEDVRQEDSQRPATTPANHPT